VAHTLHGGETHDGKCQNNQGDTGKHCAYGTASQVTNPQYKGGNECFHAADLRGLGMPGMLLEQRHLLLEAADDNQGDHHREAQNKEGQYHHNRTVSKLKGGVYRIHNPNHTQQDGKKSDDSAVNVTETKEQPLSTVCEGYKKRYVEQNPKEYILLGLFYVAINPTGQCPGRLGRFHSPAVFLLVE
jgi:hypothetical protein